MKRTNRGFAIYGKFEDSRGAQVRVQRSSEAGRKRFVWVFAAGGMASGPSVEDSAAVHLDTRQARKLAQALMRFAEGRE